MQQRLLLVSASARPVRLSTKHAWIMEGNQAPYEVAESCCQACQPATTIFVELNAKIYIGFRVHMQMLSALKQLNAKSGDAPPMPHLA